MRKELKNETRHECGNQPSWSRFHLGAVLDISFINNKEDQKLCEVIPVRYIEKLKHLLIIFTFLILFCLSHILSKQK